MIWAFDVVGVLFLDMIKVGLLLLSGEERTYEALYLRVPAIAAEELYGDVGMDLMSRLSEGGEDEEVKEEEGVVTTSVGSASSSILRKVSRLSNSSKSSIMERIALDIEKGERAGPVFATTPGQMVASSFRPYPLVQKEL